MNVNVNVTRLIGNRRARTQRKRPNQFNQHPSAAMECNAIIIIINIINREKKLYLHVRESSP